MRFAYADPPYLGCCGHYGHRHEGGFACWDMPATHEYLIRQLVRDYPDGWALSASMKSLPVVLAACPASVLTLSWVKPIAPPMGDHRHYSWEPVILHGGRRPRGYVHSHLVLSPPQFTFRPRPIEHVIGEKPEGFCHWLFEAAGLEDADELVDLFPGSGAVRRAWISWRDQMRLAL